MRKKIFSNVLLLIGLFQFLPLTQAYGLVFAQPVKQIYPPYRNNNQTIFGEDQFYTVTFRGNGEAVVTMKAIVTNTTDSAINSVTLHIPSNITISDAAAYQVIAQPQCVQYNNELTPQTTPPNQLNQPKCLQYQQPDYRYVPEDTTYKKIDINQSNDTITLNLPTAINANDTGSYLILFRTPDMTHKNIFGAYSYTFESLKVNDPINSMQIGITTDSDLYLKDAKGTVQYNTPSMAMAAMPKDVDAGVQNSEFNNFYNQIGNGDISKTAADLAPMESYTVNGAYADAGIKLYGKEIAITVVILLLILFSIIGIPVYFLKRRTNHAKKEQAMPANMYLFLAAAGISFGSVFLASIYTIGILLLFLFINSLSYGFYLGNLFILLFITALSGAVYLFLLFVPTILITIKKGFLWGGVTFGFTILWFIIAFIILFGIAFLVFSNLYNPPPIVRPLMMGGTSASGAAIPNAKPM